MNKELDKMLDEAQEGLDFRFIGNQANKQELTPEQVAAKTRLQNGFSQITKPEIDEEVSRILNS